MKIRSLDLIAFGCFGGRRLDFDGGRGDLQLLHGRNEAGKSTALRAVRSLLFGVPEGTPDAFRHANKDLRIGARLQLRDGQEIDVVRRKGRRDTLLGSDNKPLSEDALGAFLGGVEEEEFSIRFGFGFEEVRAGGSNLLKGQGDLAESLFEAGTGLLGTRRLIESLQKEYEALFVPLGRNPTVNRAIGAYDAARREAEQASCRAGRYRELDDDLKTQLAAREVAQRELSEKQAAKQRLERFRSALPDAARRVEALADLSALAGVIELPEQAAAERQEASRRLREGTAAREKAEQRLEEIRERMGLIDLPQPLLDRAAEIEALHARLDGYNNAQKDLPDERARHAGLRRHALGLLQAIRPDLGLERADELRLPVARQAELRKLASDHPVLAERNRRAAKDLETARTELADAQERLAAAVAPPDVSDLKQALSRAQQEGRIEEEARQEAVSIEQLEAQAAQDLAALGLWSGTLAALESLPVPGVESFDRCAAAFTGLENDRRLLAKEIEDANSRATSLETERRSLEIGGDIPTESALQAAREHRRRGWGLIRRAWVDSAPDPEGELEYGGGVELPTAFEASTERADEIADRLRREAERTGTLARILADQERAAEDLRLAREREQELLRRQQQTTDDWRQLWQPAGMEPLTPTEMRPWLDRRSLRTRQAQEIRNRRLLLEERRRRIDALRSDIALATLRGAGEAEPPGTSLAQEVDQAVQRIDLVNGQVKQIDALRKDVDRFEEAIGKAGRDQKTALRELKEWEKRWAAASAALGLPQTPTPEAALAVIDSLTELFSRLDESQDPEVRITEMEQYSRGFEEQAEALGTALAPGSGVTGADPVARMLNARLATALGESVKLAGLRQQAEELEQEIETSKLAVEAASVELRRLCDQARCDDEQSLEEAERRSNEARRLKAQLIELNDRLMNLSAGEPVEALVAEVAAIDADMLPAQIDDLSAEIAGLETRRSDLDQAIGRARTSRDLIDGGDAAALKAEEAQGALAVVRAGAEQYAVRRLAVELLRLAMERYRERNQDPVLRRAGELFAQLTCGAFRELQSDYDEKDRPVVMGVRTTGETVRVAGMSHGTRDQLYLALRLASLERYEEGRESFPLFLDDVLINFDDGRAQAALEVLADVSKQTQILLFTHHHRLVDLVTSTERLRELVCLHEL